MKNLVTILVLGLLALCLASLVYMELHFRYRITVPGGRSTTSYYTNAYSQRGGCVRFLEEGSRDSSQVCGMYSIIQLR